MASIKRNFAYNILLNVSNVLFPFITGPYVARVLEPDGIGLASFASNFAGYFVLFAGLGYYTYSLREISKLRDNVVERQKFVGQIFTILVINTLVVYATFLGSIFLLPKMREHFLIFFIAGCSILFVPFNIEWYFGGLERFGFITSRNLIIRSCVIIGLFIFVKTKSDLYIYMILYVLSGIGGVCWNLFEMKKDGVVVKFVRKGIKRHYKPMLILFASSVAISIYTMIDTLMLGLISDYSEVGFYHNATSISKTILALVTSLSAVALPRITYYTKQNDIRNLNLLFSKSFNVISFLAIPAMIGIMCISPVFVPLFYGEAFRGAIIPLMIMGGVIVAIGFNNITGTQILLGMGYDSIYLKCILVGACTNFLLNLVIIPHFGASGAATSSVIAELLILLVTIIAIRKKTPVRFINILPDVVKAFIASLLFIPIAFGIRFVLNGWLSVLAIIASCAVVYLFAQKLFKSQSYELFAPLITKLFKKKSVNV